jgi:hypothetical protein
VGAKEALRQAVVFQRAEEQQAPQRGVFTVAPQDVLRNRGKNFAGVTLGPQFAFELAASARGPALVVDDGPVESFLAREMPEDKGLVHPCPLGDLARGRPLKPLPREQLRGHLHDLLAPIRR